EFWVAANGGRAGSGEDGVPADLDVVIGGVGEEGGGDPYPGGGGGGRGVGGAAGRDDGLWPGGRLVGGGAGALPGLRVGAGFVSLWRGGKTREDRRGAETQSTTQRRREEKGRILRCAQNDTAEE